MNKVLKTSLALGIAVFWWSSPVQAQLAKQNLSVQEISQKINELAAKSDDASKAQLLKEAKALADAKNEAYNSLAARLYSFIGDDETAEKITKNLAKKYPKGTAARNAGMQKIFEDEKSSIDQKTKAYQAWLKKFPAESFPANDQMAYARAASRIAIDMFKANRGNEANALIREYAGTPAHIGIVTSVASELQKEGDYDQSIPMLQEAYESILREETPNMRNNALLGLYAKALVHTGKAAEGVAIAETLMTGRILPGDVLTLAKGYEQLGRELDAFQVLENFLVNSSLNQEILAAIEPLYTKLNNNKSDFGGYHTALNDRIKAATKAKYKAEMIEKDAPAFTLTNMKGETVSLKDYLGKIVIIDFWATWCGPCIMSFPGMQAAVNKYANDPEVEFLFINTWQSEENYKELVTNFINEHNYNFHVLYDEMKDRDRATVTAYGVRGIPTKVFIDQQGKIRFQSAGGNANVDVVVGEMDAKIELIKEATAGAQ